MAIIAIKENINTLKYFDISNFIFISSFVKQSFISL